MRSITQTLKLLLCALPFIIIVSAATPVFAEVPGGEGTAPTPTSTATTNCSSAGANCDVCDNGTEEASLQDCTQKCPDGKTVPQDQDCATTGGNCTNISDCDLIVKYINPFVDFLAALVGVAVVISIIIGGIQYSSSAGDPGKASAAKERIRNAVIALIVFIFLFSMLNFLIPGGLV